MFKKGEKMDWIGRQVKIVLRDGYTKYGRLVAEDALFVEIQYNNRPGSERIAKSEIASIKLDGW